MNKKLYHEKDEKANLFADRVEECFKRDRLLVQQYDDLDNGKWKHLINQVHIGYRSWYPPQYDTMPEVFRVKPNEVQHGNYIFEEKNGTVVMEAEHYFETINAPKTEWEIIPDMGRTLSGLSLFPYTEKTEGASVSYRFKLKNKAKSLKVHLFFDSTLPFKKGGHSVRVKFDNGEEKQIGINQDLTWANNYSKMYPAAAARMIEKVETFTVPVTELQTLSLQPLDPGIVLYKIVIDNGGYEETFLKMNESPYQR